MEKDSVTPNKQIITHTIGRQASRQNIQKLRNFMTQTKQENSKVLVHENTAAITAYQAACGNLQHQIQRVLDSANKLGIGEFNESNLDQLVNDPQGLVNQIILDSIKETKVAGFTVKKEEILKQLHLPDTSALIAAVNGLKNLMSQRNIQSLHADFIFGNGQVLINEDQMNQALESHRIYAVTDEEKAAAKMYQDFRAAYLKLHNHLRSKNYGGMTEKAYNQFFSIGENSELEFNHSFYKTLID